MTALVVQSEGTNPGSVHHAFGGVGRNVAGRHAKWAPVASALNEQVAYKRGVAGPKKKGDRN